MSAILGQTLKYTAIYGTAEAILPAPQLRGEAQSQQATAPFNSPTAKLAWVGATTMLLAKTKLIPAKELLFSSLSFSSYIFMRRCPEEQNSGGAMPMLNILEGSAKGGLAAMAETTLRHLPTFQRYQWINHVQKSFVNRNAIPCTSGLLAGATVCLLSELYKNPKSLWEDVSEILGS